MLLRSDALGWPCYKNIIPCEEIRRIYVLDALEDNDGISSCSFSKPIAHIEIQHDTLVRPIICSKTGILFPHEPFY